MIEAVIAALAVGLPTAGLVRPVLRWLPETTQTQQKTLYRDLATTAFILTCGVLAAGASALAWLTLDRAVQPMWWVLSSAGLLLAAIDARTTWLPLRLTRVAWLLMAAATLVSVAWGGDRSMLLRVALGAAAAGTLYFVVWRASRGGFGFGDVRFAPLLGAAGAAQSWTLLLWTLVLGTMVGGLHGVVRLVRRQREGFPYAPSMLAGAYLACAALALTA